MNPEKIFRLEFELSNYGGAYNVRGLNYVVKKASLYECGGTSNEVAHNAVTICWNNP